MPLTLMLGREFEREAACQISQSTFARAILARSGARNLFVYRTDVDDLPANLGRAQSPNERTGTKKRAREIGAYRIRRSRARGRRVRASVVDDDNVAHDAARDATDDARDRRFFVECRNHDRYGGD